MATLLELLELSASQYPDKVAVVIPDEYQLTYSQFLGEVAKAKQFLLKQGVKPGDVIGITLINNLRFLVSFFAVVGVRAVAAPLNPAYKVDDFLFYMQDTNMKANIVPQGIADTEDAVKAANQQNMTLWKVSDAGGAVTFEISSSIEVFDVTAQKPIPEDKALFLHTSGTTSKPKGVPLTHHNLSVSLSNIAQTYKLTPNDASMIVMPLFHVHGLLGATLSTLKTGGTVVVPPRFSATTFWDHVKNVTWYSAVPTIHQILLLRAETEPHVEIPKLRFIRSCSSSLAPATFQKLVGKFQAPVLEAYGMTEASHQMSSNPLPEDGPAKLGTVGKPTNVLISIRKYEEDEELPVGDLGEICIKGENVTLGYHNRPDANKANWTESGWFRTGDQGSFDADGYLTIASRIKELINRGGEKISPVELDSILIAHPKVSQAVFFAAPDEKYGEIVCAAVVPIEGEAITEQDIIDYCKEKMASFKVPQKVFVSDFIPRTATGKVQRMKVAEHFLANK